MKRFLGIMTFTLGVVLWSPAELLENGDFAKGMDYWHLHLSNHYGPPWPTFELNDGVLEGSNLHGSQPGYLHLTQAVNIRKGKRYKLSFEVKGPGAGSFRAGIRHIRKKGHCTTKPLTPGTSWETVEVEFEGAFDTDESWFKKWRSATKKSKLEDNRTSNPKLRDLDTDRMDDPPSHSILAFGMHTLGGSIAIRNVSVVELP